jgi:twitching motility protein PilT
MRLICLEALTTIGSRTAAPHVAALLAIDELDVDTRLAVLRCLRQLDDPGQAHAVRHQLRSGDPAVRDLATELLGRWQVAKTTDSGRFVLPTGTVLEQLLLAVSERGGDDLILSPGRKPAMKRMGQVESLAKNVLSGEQVRSMLSPHLSVKQQRDLDALKDVDFSYAIVSPPLRFRVNVFRQAGGLGAVFRVVKEEVPRLSELGLPPIVQSLGDLKNGLVLVGGPTGAGKSTTLAALIHHINATRSRHIVTFEDPIEVVHRRALSLVNQREIGTHTNSLPDALRATLRQDPDVILVGEMRDRSTIQFGVTAAETGHLVFGTVHIVSAAGAIDRLINACPVDQQDNMRSMLAGCLRAVVCQYLHPRKDGSGRCLSVEVLLNNEAVANLIRKNKTYQIPSIMATSREQGMQLMDWDILRLLRDGQISAEDAYLRADSKKDFERFLPEAAGTEGKAAASAAVPETPVAVPTAPTVVPKGPASPAPPSTAAAAAAPR